MNKKKHNYIKSEQCQQEMAETFILSVFVQIKNQRLNPEWDWLHWLTINQYGIQTMNNFESQHSRSAVC